MANDIESFLRETFGDGYQKITGFQQAQIEKMTTKIGEIARQALHDDLTRMQQQISELRTRVVELETERLERAAESVEPT